MMSEAPRKADPLNPKGRRISDGTTVYVTDRGYVDENAFYYPAFSQVTVPKGRQIPKGWVTLASLGGGAHPIEKLANRDMEIHTAHARRAKKFEG